MVGRACKSGLRMCECVHDKGCANAGIEGGEVRRVRVFPLQLCLIGALHSLSTFIWLLWQLAVACRGGAVRH